VIEFDPAGQMTGIVRSERNIAHRLIEEFMLAANQAVARYLEGAESARCIAFTKNPIPRKFWNLRRWRKRSAIRWAWKILRSAHGCEARRTKPQRFDRGAAAAGIRRRAATKPMTVSLPGTLDIAIRPSALPAPGRKNRGQARRAHRLLPDAALAQAGALCRRAARAFRAGVRPVHAFHFAHPPLSRPDRSPRLKWALDHPESRPAGRGFRRARAQERRIHVRSISPRRTRGHRVETSETERRAETAERELMAWKTAQFMEQHLGEEYDALIISVQKFGFFVELTEIFVEGIVPIDRIEELTGEQAFYRERDHAIVSGSGRWKTKKARFISGPEK
jgi:ribonuclease R